MSITFPLSTGISSHFGGPTVTLLKNVGSGSNRMAFALSGYSATGSAPAGFAVGSDTLTLIGSVTTVSPSGTQWALYQGALTVSGSQTISATYSGTFASGFATAVILIAQGGGALTFAHALTVAENDIGSASSTNRVITSASGDVAVVLEYDLNFSSTPTPQSPATVITNDTGPPGFYTLQSAGLATSTTVQTNWSGAATVIHAGFTLTEAGGAAGRIFRNSPSGQLSGLGSSGPFFQNPLQ